MFRFILLIKGYYRITVDGFGAERFINLCKIKNIYLWDMHISQTMYTMNISKQDYEMLSEIVNKTGVKVDILKRYGLPFWFLKKKSRMWYLAFLCIAVMLIFVSNRFVWNIEFKGNYTISDEQLEDFLGEYNISFGVLKRKIPYALLEENLRKDFPIIKWCSVALSGNTLTVNVEENTLLKENEITDISEGYSDIVAESDGIVKNILVRNGLALVKEGDLITKGQILVTGCVPIYDDSLLIKSYQYYDADADVEIETNINYEDFQDDIYFEKEYSGRTKDIAYLKINEIDIHLPLNLDYAYYDVYTTSKQLKLFGRIILPVYYGTYEVREYYLVEKQYVKEEVVKIFNDNFIKYYESLSEKGVQILEKNVKIEHNASKWVLKGNLVISFYNSKKEYKEKQLENIVQ